MNHLWSSKYVETNLLKQVANWTNWQDGEPNNLGGQVVTDDNEN